MFQRITFHQKTLVVNYINSSFPGLVILQKACPEKAIAPQLGEHDAHLASGLGTSQLGNSKSQGTALRGVCVK